MAQTQDSGAVLAGLMAALADPAKATAQLAEMKAQQDLLDQRLAQIAEAQADLVAKGADWAKVAEQLHAKELELAETNQTLIKRDEALQIGEQRLAERQKRLAEEVEAHRAKVKENDVYWAQERASQDARAEEVAQREAAIMEQLETIGEQEASLAERESALVAAELAHQERVAKLKTLLGE